MKNHLKEKRERNQKILKEQKKFKEWEIIFNFYLPIKNLEDNIKYN